MPQRIREQVLDRCLSDQKVKYTTQDLMNACNSALVAEGYEPVRSLNTIRADLESIAQHWSLHGGNVVMEREGRNKYYHYADPNFSIYHTGLTADELTKLNQTLQVLRRFQGLPQFEWIEELNARFKSSFLVSPNTQTIISFDSNPYTEGKQYVSTLFDAIDRKCVCAVTYQSFASEESHVMRVHPYHLKEYSSRWYLLGWRDDKNSLVTLALDRMLKVEFVHSEYRENTEYDFTEYFDDVIGITVIKEAPAELVRIWVSKEQYPYMRTKPLHGSQKVVEHREDGSKVIQIEVKENYELIQQLLSFGEKVVVLSPDHIRKKIQERIWWAGENYDKIR